MFSNFKVGRTVFIHGFGYFVPPIIMLAVWYPNRTSDEEKRKILTEKYGDKVRAAQAGQKNMQAFFDKVKAGDEGLNDQLESILLGGKRSEVQPWAAEQAKAAAAGAPVSLEKANAASSEAAPLPKRKLETTRVEPS